MSPLEVPRVPRIPKKSWQRWRGQHTCFSQVTRPGLPHLQDGGALLILVHLGGQPVELEGHAAQVGEELAVVGLLRTHAQGGLQALQVQQQVAVFVGSGAQLLAGVGDRGYSSPGLSRRHRPFSRCFPIPHDSVSP